MRGFLDRWGGFLALTAIVLLLPLLLPNRFYFDMAVKVWLNAIVCVGLNLLIGYAGQISLGHAGFFALGAYASAILTRRYEIPGLIAMFAGAAGVGLLAFLVARPILKLKGHYLAMATLGLGIIIAIVINREICLTGGPDGTRVPALWIGEWRVAGIEQWYWVAGGAMLLSVWLALNLIGSGVGRALRALNGSEVAGSLFAHAERFVTPQEAGFLRSIEFVTMVVLGGMASTYGAVVGAALLTVLPQAVADFQDFKHLAFGAILIACMIFLPKGLVPSIGEFWARLRK
jgi:branched-chain amino acid transport system permease protein